MQHTHDDVSIIEKDFWTITTRAENFFAKKKTTKKHQVEKIPRTRYSEKFREKKMLTTRYHHFSIYYARWFCSSGKTF